VTGDALLLTGTALLGSFTTFSTWMVQSERLASEGDGTLALVNVAGSLAVGLAAVVLGWSAGAIL
jgi:CrcB protein